MRVFKRIVLVAALMVPAIAQAGEIVVQGRGTVEQAPDMAVISLGARFQAHTAREALEEVNKRTQAAFTVVEKLGVEPRDMQTGNLYLNPIWDHGSNQNEVARIRGYEAGNQVTIRIRDLSVLGSALDEMVTKGANVFNGLSFALQDPTDALAEARRKAVQDARAKAELYAGAAGVALGPVISINETNVAPPRPRFMARAEMAMDAGVPVAPGELSTQATITIVYEIAE
ncbi:SIMPL domain-containing protein [Cognatishimia sp. 1_MG-2023]|uniref:SIMPL domain-containing protein n=1 Tax=Cognatishimia sp. 1_MG-2023 TaxID=3062642 RepID=UPI0026E35FF4|nr:SIMPL domain-containing protein [Cognatishimia sp. 1_MG-2023]MDO6726326.1 SIMPL domain-containing protein [Cognatishimia sp. 1_MG-2023]